LCVGDKGPLAMKLHLLTLLAVSLLAIPVCGASFDLKPPQVGVSFIFPPSPLIQASTPRLVYEMVLTNYVPVTYRLESISVDCGSHKFEFSGEALNQMVRWAGESTSTSRTVELNAGKTAVVFFMLKLEDVSEVPDSIFHTLHFRSNDGIDHSLSPPPLPVERRVPIGVEAPLRGSHWIAGDSVHNGPTATHRRTILFEAGKPYLAQRYAIDWVRYRLSNGVAVTWSGPENRNSSYFCYGAPVYSMTSGRVTEVLDGVPDNVPHSGKVAIDVNFKNAGGNHVVIYIGYGLYAFYAHMQPGTIKVKMGEHVATGQLLGLVGNSGNSTEPHLHEHIVNRSSFLAGQGVPYEFEHFQASGPTDLISGPHDQMRFRNIGSLKPFNNDYPAANAAVSFQ